MLELLLLVLKKDHLGGGDGAVVSESVVSKGIGVAEGAAGLYGGGKGGGE